MWQLCFNHLSHGNGHFTSAELADSSRGDDVVALAEPLHDEVLVS